MQWQVPMPEEENDFQSEWLSDQNKSDGPVLTVNPTSQKSVSEMKDHVDHPNQSQQQRLSKSKKDAAKKKRTIAKPHLGETRHNNSNQSSKSY